MSTLIIGGGLEGLAIAWAFTEAGETDVQVVERHTLCSGMTGKSSGVVRCHYGTASLAAMSWHSLNFFTHATELVDDDLGFRQCGYTVGVGADNVEPLLANVAMQRGLGIEVELIDHAQLASLWPGLRVDDYAGIAYEPLGGRGDAYLAGMGFAAAARRGGVRIRQQTEVARLRQRPTGEVCGALLTSGEEIGADTVVLAAGPWTAGIAATVGVDVPVRAQRAQVVMVDAGELTPIVPVLSDLVSLQYLCREPNGELLVGNSDHATPEYLDPDGYRNRADDATIDTTVDKISHRLPNLPNPGIAGSYVGAYDVTPDYNPIIGPSPLEGLFLAAGFSGHGFKISPAVGQLVADLVLRGATTLKNVDPHDFRYSRFAEGEPLLSPHPYVGAGEMR